MGPQGLARQVCCSDCASHLQTQAGVLYVTPVKRLCLLGVCARAFVDD